MTAINRPLTDAEKSLLINPGIRTVADATGHPTDAIGDVLEQLNADGEMLLHVDAEHAWITVRGSRIVTAARDWLAFHAAVCVGGGR
jgi:hypothetical protein